MIKNKTRLTGMVGFTAVAASAGALFFGAAAAHAAAPPYEPDISSTGTLTFYNSSGQVITGGPTDTAPFAAYAVGSNAVRSGDNKAALYFAAPDPGQTPVNYYVEPVGVFNVYPITTGPANLQALSADTPVNIGKANNQTLDGFRSDLASPSTAAGYDGVVQVRLRTANPQSQITQQYDVADVKVDPTTHTWTQVYPAPTTTTVVASPNPVAQGDTDTITATEKLSDNSGVAAGSVQFQADGTNLGSPVAVNGATGKASVTNSSLAKGTHSITATFTPTSSANGSSSGTTSLVVTAPATKTVLAVSPNTKVGVEANGTATVTGPGTTPNSSGSVGFYDNGSTTPFATVAGSAAVNGVYSFDVPTGFAAGAHSVVAVFTPTDATQFTGSTSNAAAFTVVAGACADPNSSCTDIQNIQVTVPAGTLVINTPYTASNPLDLGTMAPNSAGTQLTASKPFQNIVITDMRNGASGYTVSAQSSPLTDGGTNAGSTINAQNVGLTGVAAAGGTGFTGTIATQTNPAADPAVAPGAAGTAGLGNADHSVLVVNGSSRGTVTANGTLTINAPTSTEPGLFTGTITFTVG